MGLLGEFLLVLNQHFVDGDRDGVLEILGELSKSSRFNLSLTFLGMAEKKAVRILGTLYHLPCIFFSIVAF